MDPNIRKLDEVWTADGQMLGLAQALYHRSQDVDPRLMSYASYLEVINFEYGDNYFVPTDYVAGRDEETGRVNLSVTFKQVLERTWTRMPDFVAQGRGRKEALPRREPVRRGESGASSLTSDAAAGSRQ